jgi:CRP-like cAMP-binding protein
MISPELLRRYPFFTSLNDDQLKAIAMISEERIYPKGTVLIKENTPAAKLVLLLEGDVDLIFSGGGEGAVVNALVGSIAPGEVYGVSALIEPFTFISSAKATVQVKVVEVDGAALRALMDLDARLAFALMRNIAMAVLERLKYTQVELAAARS